MGLPVLTNFVYDTLLTDVDTAGFSFQGGLHLGSGNLILDSGSRIGVGDSNPQYNLVVMGSSLYVGSGFGLDGAGDLIFYTPTSMYITYGPGGYATIFRSGGVERVSFPGSGGLAVGVSHLSKPTSYGQGVLFFGDNAGDPVMSPGTAGIYAKDVAGTVELFALDEAGNTTQLSSHNFDLFTPDSNLEFPWSFYHRNPYVGYEEAVDMAQLVKLVEEMSGKQLVYRRPLPPQETRDWHADQVASRRLRKRRAAAEEELEISESEAIEKRPESAPGAKYGLRLPAGTRLKGGARWDSHRGKFMRRRQVRELDAMDFSVSEEEVKRPPGWLHPRLPRKRRVNPRPKGKQP